MIKSIRIRKETELRNSLLGLLLILETDYLRNNETTNKRKRPVTSSREDSSKIRN